MNHDEALRQKATERYLLDELDSELKDQFEEHLFDCQDCALDVRAAAMFVEQSKAVLAEPAVTSPLRHSAPARAGWAWFRPAFAVPVLALLLAVVGYQNLVSYPRLLQAMNQPQVGPWASINVGTRGVATTVIKARPGEGFNLLVSLPPEYSAYTFELHNPAGQLEWSRTIPASSLGDTPSIFVPGAGLEQGSYTFVVSGSTGTDGKLSLGSYPIDLQIQQ
jgi:hypothetical protein